ncbi:MAG TPA: CBS domain-containing protein [Longimicrobiales bacterium]
MIRVRDVMSPEPVCVSPETTLREVAEILSGAGISGAPVIAAGEGVVGVISASDIIDFVASSPGVPTEREDGGDWDDIISAEKDEPEPSFVDLWEDAGADVLERFREVAGPEWNVLEEHTAAEVMTSGVVSIGPEQSLVDAARAMLDNRVHRLIVIEDGRVLGVITETDLVASQAGGKTERAEAPSE